jgi:sulfate adenylyltransferase subunit 1
VTVFPSGQQAVVVQVKQAGAGAGPVRHSVPAGWSAGLVLDRELDISRGDWLMASSQSGAVPTSATATATHAAAASQDQGSATLAWMDEEALTAGRSYWALHGHRWLKVRVERVLARRNLLTLAEEPSDTLQANDIGRVWLRLQTPVPWLGFAQSRSLGAMILVDTASHRTAAAVLLDPHAGSGAASP